MHDAQVSGLEVGQAVFSGLGTGGKALGLVLHGCGPGRLQPDELREAVHLLGFLFAKLVEVVLNGKALFVGQLLVGNVKDIGDLLLDGVERGDGSHGRAP